MYAVHGLISLRFFVSTFSMSHHNGIQRKGGSLYVQNMVVCICSNKTDALLQENTQFTRRAFAKCVANIIV